MALAIKRVNSASLTSLPKGKTSSASPNAEMNPQDGIVDDHRCCDALPETIRDMPGGNGSGEV
jgi:hypothetical protein